MFKVKVYSVGKSKEAWLQEALAEYTKRLSPHMEIEWVLVKTDAELASKVSPPFIVLDVEGEQVDSPGLARKLSHLWMAHGSKIHFVIGGSDGLDPVLVQKSVWRWSLSKLTFTHQMTRLILLEQLYRALQIDAGTAYHK